jgi:hypothetical protein
VGWARELDKNLADGTRKERETEGEEKSGFIVLWKELEG